MSKRNKARRDELHRQMEVVSAARAKLPPEMPAPNRSDRSYGIALVAIVILFAVGFAAARGIGLL